MENQFVKKRIVHLVTREKFSAGYINFMKYDMDAYEHFFVILNGEKLALLNDENMHYIKWIGEILYSKKIRKLLSDCDKVIVSGFFYFYRICIFLPRKILRKMYIQFWGGDFYRLEKNRLQQKIEKEMIRISVKRCNQVLVLIEEDYESLSKILKCKQRYMVAPMAACTKQRFDYSSIDANQQDSMVRILVGNSAAPENEHMEIFHMLSHLREEDIEIVCPLSYGNEEYKAMLLDKGKEIFGEKFVPVTDYLPKDKYISFLSKCSVAIFNNNRQQAMGNINIMIRLGKKVYIKDSTSMWKFFVREGIKLWNVNELKNISMEELNERDEERIDRNKQLRYEIDIEYKKKWEKVLESEK